MEKPFQQRMTELQTKIAELCKEYSIELVPIINRTLQMDQVQIIFVDLKNPEQVKKFGLGNKQTTTPSILVN
jgi:hypothetical protein